MARRKKRHARKGKWCVKAGKTTKKCFKKKSAAKKYARGRRKRGLKARIVHKAK